MPSSPTSRRLSLSPLRQTLANVLVTLSAALATFPQAAAGPLAFAGSCNLPTAQLSKNWFGIYCNNLNTASFGYNWTWIDLDACVANSGGRLVGKKNGNFLATCAHCNASLSRLTANQAAGRSGSCAYASGLTLDLHCTCLNGYERLPVSSTLNLNKILVNVDGAMGCYGRLGNKTLQGPPSKH